MNILSLYVFFTYIVSISIKWQEGSDSPFEPFTMPSFTYDKYDMSSQTDIIYKIIVEVYPTG